MLKMKTIAIGAALTMSATAFAGLGDKLERKWEESTGLSKLFLGHTNKATNLGISHERRQGALGIEAMIFASSDNGGNEDNNNSGNKDRQETLSLGLMHHLEDNSNADVFLGTGLAYTRHEDVTVDGDEEDVNSFGPMFKIGSNYYLNNDWSLGLEYMVTMNWNSDDVASQQSYGFATLGYTY